MVLVAEFGFYLTTTLHHDVSWYLVATGRLLDGAHLYADIIEVNPPLAFYLTIPPVAVARLIEAPAEPIFISYVFVLILSSLLIVRRLLDQAALSSTYRCIMLLASTAALTIAPVGVFGQREHLMLLFALPYLFLLPGRLADHRCQPLFAGVIGVLAAVGFCLKPHFLLVPVSLELYLMVRRRSPWALWRPETCGLLLGAASYVAFVVVVHPLYIDFIMPNAMLVYDAYSSSIRHVLSRPAVFAILPIVTLYAVVRISGVAGPTANCFAIATIGFFVAYVVQSKGWTYHLLPVTAAGCLTAAAVVVESPSVRQVMDVKVRRLLRTVGSAVMAIPLLLQLAGGAYHNPFADKVLPDVKRYAGNGTLYSFTSHVWVSFPLVNEADLQWTSRFPTQWLLPGALRRLAEPATLDWNTEQRLRQIARYAVDAVIEDLERMPPDFVIVDKHNPYFGELDFDFLAYFSHEPRFVAFWRPYVKVKDITSGQNRRVFEIWCRRDATHRCAG